MLVTPFFQGTLHTSSLSRSEKKRTDNNKKRNNNNNIIIIIIIKLQSVLRGEKSYVINFSSTSVALYCIPYAD